MLTLNEPQATETEKKDPDISQEVLKRRCLIKDPDGNVIETPEQMYMRVAKTIAEVESQYDTREQVVRLLPARRISPINEITIIFRIPKLIIYPQIKLIFTNLQRI